MHLREIQRLKREFDMRRGWDKFPPSLAYVHLTEELAEIGRHILYLEGYKVKGLGHEGTDENELGREFAQSFNLLVQLANQLDVDLEAAVMNEHGIMKKRFDASKWRKYMEIYDGSQKECRKSKHGSRG